MLADLLWFVGPVRRVVLHRTRGGLRSWDVGGLLSSQQSDGPADRIDAGTDGDEPFELQHDTRHDGDENKDQVPEGSAFTEEVIDRVAVSDAADHQ